MLFFRNDLVGSKAKAKDSDLDCSSDERHSTDIDSDLEASSTCQSDTDDYEFCNEENDLDKDWRVIALEVEQADSLCMKLNELIRRGKIGKDRIFYKYLQDVVEIFYDPRHKYDDEVVEFFNALSYLGGRRVVNMIRGPMFLGQGRGSVHPLSEAKMNLGGPSETVCLKRQAGYTTRSGILKPLSLAHYKLSSVSIPQSTSNRFISTQNLAVYPAVLADDGTPLKAAIQFDERMKQIVGLTHHIDKDFVSHNPQISPDQLSGQIITEALVSSVTCLDNICSLPCGVEYSAQSGKTGNEMESLFLNEIRVLQMCESCQKEAAASEHVLRPETASMCHSVCDTCLALKEVCNECEEKGHVSYIPSVRACKRCLDQNKLCSRRVILGLTTDCEEGNKKAMSQIKEKIQNGTIDPEFSLLSVLPDCPHVGKCLKGSFANWFLQLENERGNLALIATLRNRSDPRTKITLKGYLPKNDDVKNKDRHDPFAVF